VEEMSELDNLVARFRSGSEVDEDVDAQDQQRVPESDVDEGMPETQRGDADEKIAELEAEYNKIQEDMNKMRSTYDRNAAQKEAEFAKERQEMERRLFELRVQDMEDSERTQYERDYYEQQLNEMRSVAEQQRLRAENLAQVPSYLKMFVEAGVPLDELDTANPDELLRSGWEGMVNANVTYRQKLADMESRLKELESGEPKQKEKKPAVQTKETAPKKPSPVVTEHGETPSDIPSRGDVMKALEAELGYPPTEDEVFTMVEQGELKPEILLSFVRTDDLV
jgi:hypothetical protein